jgi:hypothetical protein
MGAQRFVVKGARVLNTNEESQYFQGAPRVPKVVATIRAAAIRGAAGVWDARRD